MKTLFMPIIYGKTPFSSEKDLKAKLKGYWSAAVIDELVKVSFAFWTRKCNKIDNLMGLVQAVSSITTQLGYNIVYGNNSYKTIQNYCEKKDEVITVYYNRTIKKRSRVTIKVKTNIRDVNKSMRATFANFIHQRDALMVMHVVEHIRDIEQTEKIHIPIYTIHDNFLTTVEHATKMPSLYREALSRFGDPLFLIKKFIYQNLIERAVNLGLTEDAFSSDPDKPNDRRVFYISRALYEDDALASVHKGIESFETLLQNFHWMNPKDTERLQFQAQRNNTTLQEEIVLAMIKNPFMLYIPPFTANILKFSIARCMNLPPESKEIKKKVRKIMHCYDAYTKLIALKRNNGEWAEYVTRLLRNENKHDYCIHH
jgi:hypothetical protein